MEGNVLFIGRNLRCTNYRIMSIVQKLFIETEYKSYDRINLEIEDV